MLPACTPGWRKAPGRKAPLSGPFALKAMLQLGCERQPPEIMTLNRRVSHSPFGI